MVSQINLDQTLPHREGGLSCFHELARIRKEIEKKKKKKKKKNYEKKGKTVLPEKKKKKKTHRVIKIF